MSSVLGMRSTSVVQPGLRNPKMNTLNQKQTIPTLRSPYTYCPDYRRIFEMLTIANDQTSHYGTAYGEITRFGTLRPHG